MLRHLYVKSCASMFSTKIITKVLYNILQASPKLSKLYRNTHIIKFEVETTWLTVGGLGFVLENPYYKVDQTLKFCIVN